LMKSRVWPKVQRFLIKKKVYHPDSNRLFFKSPKQEARIGSAPQSPCPVAMDRGRLQAIKKAWPSASA